MPSDPNTDPNEVILLPERMPCLVRPPSKRGRYVKGLFLVLLLAACAAVLLYWWSGLPVSLDGKIARGTEIWVKATREGEVTKIFVEPGQTVTRDEPLLRFQLGQIGDGGEDAALHLAVLEGTLSHATFEKLTKRLRDAEEQAQDEMMRASLASSQAVYRRRSLEAREQDKNSPAVGEARDREAEARQSYEAAGARLEKASNARALALTRTEEFAAEVRNMDPKKREQLKELYRKKLAESQPRTVEEDVFSPLSGVVIESNASVGMKLLPSTPLFSLMPHSHGEFSCQAEVGEKTAGRLAAGMYCEAEVAEKLYPGRIAGIHSAADETGQEKKLVIMNFSGMEDDEPYNLPSGSPVKILVYPREEKK